MSGGEMREGAPLIKLVSRASGRRDLSRSPRAVVRGRGGRMGEMGFTGIWPGDGSDKCD